MTMYFCEGFSLPPGMDRIFQHTASLKTSFFPQTLFPGLVCAKEEGCVGECIAPQELGTCQILPAQ